ncbi:MAG: SdrD B-like domain-containing protein [Anaerolineales bacterium]|jgi:uncharacterized protein YraI
MTKRIILLALGALGILMLLGACDFIFPLSSGCDPRSLEQPILTSPAPDSLVHDLSTPLLWDLPTTARCPAEGFRLEIASDGSFSTILSTKTFGADDYSYVPFPPFDPGMEYFWRVAAGHEDGAGDLTLGPWSTPSRFFTGPVCPDWPITLPIKDWPEDGATISTTTPMLDWHNPPTGCVPDNFNVMVLALSSPAGDHYIEDMTGGPNTEWSPDPGEELYDCTEYRWWVWPDFEVPEGERFDILGTNFYIDLSGSCPEHGSGIIGRLWHDECGLPELGPPLLSPPPGCIESDGDFIADGFLDMHERGIEGAVVQLGEGACPSTGLATTTTNRRGAYFFPDLEEGTYCVSIDPLSEPNDGLLLPGWWSYPEIGVPLASTTATVWDGWVSADFGWDYQFLPSFDASEISGLVWNDQCEIPPGDPPESPPPGCVDIEGEGFVADGIYDGTEPGIPSVTLHLGIGPCPSTGYWWTETALEGTYSFPGLLDGTYCVTVDATADGNDEILLPGRWTHPERNVNPATHEITVTIPDDAEDVIFGWEFTFLEPLPFARMKVRAIDDVNCRTGPSIFYPLVWIMEEAEEAEADGRNQSSTWIRIDRQGVGESCWIAASYLELDFPIEELPVQSALPLPANASISGSVFDDDNGNGQWDGGEGSIAGATLTLKSGSCPGSSTVGTSTSSPNGWYSLTGLTPGYYCIHSFYGQGILLPQTRDITLHAGEDLQNVNFRLP